MPVVSESDWRKLESDVLLLVNSNRLKEAFRAYWEEMGNYSNLGRVQGRAGSALRVLTALRKKLKTWEGAAQLNRRDRSMIYNDMALFLTDLGALDDAFKCYSEYAKLSRDDTHNHKQALINLSYIDALRGKLPSASDFAKESLKKPAFGPSLNLQRYASAYLGNSLAKQGFLEEARKCFAEAVETPPGFNYSLMGIYHAELHIREDEHTKALLLTENNLKFCERHESRRDMARCQIILGLLNFPKNRTQANDMISAAHGWNAQSKDAEISILLEIVRGSNHCNAGNLDESIISLIEAYRQAESCGYLIHRIDAGNACARIDFLRGNVEMARSRAEAMLADATGDECHYYFGQRDALSVLVAIAKAAGHLTDYREYRTRLDTLCREGLPKPQREEPEEGIPLRNRFRQTQTDQKRNIPRSHSAHSDEETSGPEHQRSTVSNPFGKLFETGKPSGRKTDRRAPNPAQVRLRQIKKELGPYPDWDDALRDQILSLLRAGADPLIQAWQAFGWTGIDAEEGTRILESYYGLGSSPDEDFPDSLARFLTLVTPFLSEEDQQQVEKVAAGHLPRLHQYDVLTDELIPYRLANSISIPLEDGQGYIIGTTTAFSKMIMDWSSLISSTGQGDVRLDNPADILSKMSKAMADPGELENLLSGYEKSPTEMLDGLAKSVELRWIQGKTPPTWEMNYMPEEIAANEEWMLRNNLCQATIEIFFLLHELGHVCLGHLDKENAANSAQLADKELTVENLHANWEEEIEADHYAGSVLAKIVKGLTDAVPIAGPYAQYGLQQLVKFLGYTDLLEEFSGSPLRTHPPSAQRVETVLKAIENARIPGLDISIMRFVAGNSTGFYAGVRRRLSSGT